MQAVPDDFPVFFRKRDYIRNGRNGGKVGKLFYTSDEYDRRMVKMDVAADGTLSNLQYFVEQGEFGSAVDRDGNLYITDGEIYIFDKDGNKKGMITVPERPSTLQFGGKDRNTLFITGRSKFFGVRIK